MPVAEQTEDLIERVAAGDRQALAELYQCYREPLLRYLRVLTSDDGLAEEILQDALFAAWNGANRFAGQSSARSWLYGIARRRARDEMRKRRFTFVDLALVENTLAHEPEPDDVVLTNAAIDDVADAIERLSIAHREALILTFVHGLSYRELAEVLGIPLGTVKSRLNHAKRALRGQLETMEETGL